MTNVNPILLKMYFRYILYIDYSIQKIYLNLNKSSQKNKEEKLEQDRNSILEYYFNNLNENKLGNATDMFLIKPYFQHLCYNSYDSTCNEYYKFINTLNKNENKYNEKFANNLIQQFNDFSKKINGLSLQEQQINELKTLFANAGANNIDDERFREITNYIKLKLDNIGQSKINTQVKQFDQDIAEEQKIYETRKDQLDEIDKYKQDLCQDISINGIQKTQDEILRIDEQIEYKKEKLQILLDKSELTPQDKKQKINLEYQLSDLQNDREKLSKKKEEYQAKYTGLLDDYNKTKNINNAERKQIETIRNRKIDAITDQKNKLLSEHGKIFLNLLTSNIESIKSIFGDYTFSESELETLNENPSLLIEKIDSYRIKTLNISDLNMLTYIYTYLLDNTSNLTEQQIDRLKTIITEIKDIKEKLKEEDILSGPFAKGVFPSSPDDKDNMVNEGGEDGDQVPLHSTFTGNSSERTFYTDADQFYKDDLLKFTRLNIFSINSFKYENGINKNFPKLPDNIARKLDEKSNFWDISSNCPEEWFNKHFINSKKNMIGGGQDEFELEQDIYKKLNNYSFSENDYNTFNESIEHDKFNNNIIKQDYNYYLNLTYGYQICSNFLLYIDRAQYIDGVMRYIGDSYFSKLKIMTTRLFFLNDLYYKYFNLINNKNIEKNIFYPFYNIFNYIQKKFRNDGPLNRFLDDNKEDIEYIEILIGKIVDYFKYNFFNSKCFFSLIYLLIRIIHKPQESSSKIEINTNSKYYYNAENITQTFQNIDHIFKNKDKDKDKESIIKDSIIYYCIIKEKTDLSSGNKNIETIIDDYISPITENLKQILISILQEFKSVYHTAYTDIMNKQIEDYVIKIINNFKEKYIQYIKYCIINILLKQEESNTINEEANALLVLPRNISKINLIKDNLNFFNTKNNTIQKFAEGLKDKDSLTKYIKNSLSLNKFSPDSDTSEIARNEPYSEIDLKDIEENKNTNILYFLIKLQFYNYEDDLVANNLNILNIINDIGKLIFNNTRTEQITKTIMNGMKNNLGKYVDGKNDDDTNNEKDLKLLKFLYDIFISYQIIFDNFIALPPIKYNKCINIDTIFNIIINNTIFINEEEEEEIENKINNEFFKDIFLLPTIMLTMLEYSVRDNDDDDIKEDIEEVFLSFLIDNDNDKLTTKFYIHLTDIANNNIIYRFIIKVINYIKYIELNYFLNEIEEKYYNRVTKNSLVFDDLFKTYNLGNKSRTQNEATTSLNIEKISKKINEFNNKLFDLSNYIKLYDDKSYDNRFEKFNKLLKIFKNNKNTYIKESNKYKDYYSTQEDKTFLKHIEILDKLKENVLQSPFSKLYFSIYNKIILKKILLSKVIFKNKIINNLLNIKILKEDNNSILLFHSYNQQRKDETEEKYMERIFSEIDNRINNVCVTEDIPKYFADDISERINQSQVILHTADADLRIEAEEEKGRARKGRSGQGSGKFRLIPRRNRYQSAPPGADPPSSSSRSDRKRRSQSSDLQTVRKAGDARRLDSSHPTVSPSSPPAIKVRDVSSPPRRGTRSISPNLSLEMPESPPPAEVHAPVRAPAPSQVPAPARAPARAPAPASDKLPPQIQEKDTVSRARNFNSQEKRSDHLTRNNNSVYPDFNQQNLANYSPKALTKYKRGEGPLRPRSGPMAPPAPSAAARRPPKPYVGGGGIDLNKDNDILLLKDIIIEITKSNKIICKSYDDYMSEDDVDEVNIEMNLLYNAFIEKYNSDSSTEYISLNQKIGDTILSFNEEISNLLSNDYDINKIIFSKIIYNYYQIIIFESIFYEIYEMKYIFGEYLPILKQNNNYDHSDEYGNIVLYHKDNKSKSYDLLKSETISLDNINKGIVLLIEYIKKSKKSNSKISDIISDIQKSQLFIEKNTNIMLLLNHYLSIPDSDKMDEPNVVNKNDDSSLFKFINTFLKKYLYMYIEKKSKNFNIICFSNHKDLSMPMKHLIDYNYISKNILAKISEYSDNNTIVFPDTNQSIYSLYYKYFIHITEVIILYNNEFYDDGDDKTNALNFINDFPLTKKPPLDIKMFYTVMNIINLSFRVIPNMTKVGKENTKLEQVKDAKYDEHLFNSLVINFLNINFHFLKNIIENTFASNDKSIEYNKRLKDMFEYILGLGEGERDSSNIKTSTEFFNKLKYLGDIFNELTRLKNSNEINSLFGELLEKILDGGKAEQSEIDALFKKNIQEQIENQQKKRAENIFPFIDLIKFQLKTIKNCKSERLLLDYGKLNESLNPKQYFPLELRSDNYFKIENHLTEFNEEIKKQPAIIIKMIDFLEPREALHEQIKKLNSGLEIKYEPHILFKTIDFKNESIKLPDYKNEKLHKNYFNISRNKTDTGGIFMNLQPIHDNTYISDKNSFNLLSTNLTFGPFREVLEPRIRNSNKSNDLSYVDTDAMFDSEDNLIDYLKKNKYNYEMPLNKEFMDYLTTTGENGYDIESKILNKKELKFFGYGFSGSGKTFTLLQGSDTDFALFAETLFLILKLSSSENNPLKIPTDLKKLIQIDVYFPLKDNDITSCNDELEHILDISGENHYKKIKFLNGHDGRDKPSLKEQINKILYETTITDPKNKGIDEEYKNKNFKQILPILNNKITSQKPTEINNLKKNFTLVFLEILEKIFALLKYYNYIIPTINNTESSRAFTIIKINYNFSNVDPVDKDYIHFIDLPGLERKVDMIIDYLIGEKSLDSLGNELVEKDKQNILDQFNCRFNNSSNVNFKTQLITDDILRNYLIGKVNNGDDDDTLIKHTSNSNIKEFSFILDSRNDIEYKILKNYCHLFFDEYNYNQSKFMNDFVDIETILNKLETEGLQAVKEQARARARADAIANSNYNYLKDNWKVIFYDFNDPIINYIIKNDPSMYLIKFIKCLDNINKSKNNLSEDWDAIKTIAKTTLKDIKDKKILGYFTDIFLNNEYNIYPKYLSINEDSVCSEFKKTFLINNSEYMIQFSLFNVNSKFYSLLYLDRHINHSVDYQFFINSIIVSMFSNAFDIDHRQFYKYTEHTLGSINTHKSKKLEYKNASIHIPQSSVDIYKQVTNSVIIDNQGIDKVNDPKWWEKEMKVALRNYVDFFNKTVINIFKYVNYTLETKSGTYILDHDLPNKLKTRFSDSFGKILEGEKEKDLFKLQTNESTTAHNQLLKKISQDIGLENSIKNLSIFEEIFKNVFKIHFFTGEDNTDLGEDNCKYKYDIEKKDKTYKVTNKITEKTLHEDKSNDIIWYFSSETKIKEYDILRICQVHDCFLFLHHDAIKHLSEITYYRESPVFTCLYIIYSLIEKEQVNDNIKKGKKLFFMSLLIEYVLKQGETIVTSLEHLLFEFLTQKSGSGFEDYNTFIRNIKQIQSEEEEEEEEEKKKLDDINASQFIFSDELQYKVVETNTYKSNVPECVVLDSSLNKAVINTLLNTDNIPDSSNENEKKINLKDLRKENGNYYFNISSFMDKTKNNIINLDDNKSIVFTKLCKDNHKNLLDIASNTSEFYSLFENNQISFNKTYKYISGKSLIEEKVVRKYLPLMNKVLNITPNSRFICNINILRNTFKRHNQDGEYIYKLNFEDKRKREAGARDSLLFAQFLLGTKFDNDVQSEITKQYDLEQSQFVRPETTRGGNIKKRRIKTIKKYKYKKNKTGKRKNGKKAKNTPKLMNAKKSNKKITISQILINNLKK